MTPEKNQLHVCTWATEYGAVPLPRERLRSHSWGQRLSMRTQRRPAAPVSIAQNAPRARRSLRPLSMTHKERAIALHTQPRAPARRAPHAIAPLLNSAS